MEFASGNVQLITTKESWDQKLEQARREGKIVSLLLIKIIKCYPKIYYHFAVLLG